MAYNNNPRPAGNRNFQSKPKNVEMKFNLSETFVATNGTVMDSSSILDTLHDLNDTGVFSILSISTQISRALLTGETDKKGNTAVGYIRAIEDNTATIVIYASSADAVKKIIDDKGLVIAPRILYNQKTQATTFISFDLVVSK